MRAIVLTAYGDAEKLAIRELPDPHPGPNEIMVRMAGASLNPIDWKLRSGALKAVMPLELPAVLGRDVSGEVVEVGPGVTGIRVGQRMMGLVNAAYAELVVAPASAWTEVPARLELADAAALPLVVLTGVQLIDEAVKCKEGDVVLVTGATGSVGRAAVYAAKARGAVVWAGVRKTHREEALTLTAAGVVALDDPADVAALPELDSIADTVGGEAVQSALGKLKRGGVIASVVGEPAGAKALGLEVRTMFAHPDAKRLGKLAQAVADGLLVIPIAKRLRLTDARQAHQLGEKGAGGKILLTP